MCMVKQAKQKAASRINQLIKAGRCNERAMVWGGYDGAQRQQNNSPTLTLHITRTEYKTWTKAWSKDLWSNSLYSLSHVPFQLTKFLSRTFKQVMVIIDKLLFPFLEYLLYQAHVKRLVCITLRNIDLIRQFPLYH